MQANRRFRCGPPESPASVAQTWRWPERYVNSLPQEAVSHLNELCSRPLWLSTCFTGIGMWETTFGFLTETLSKGDSLHCFACADVEEACIHTLLHHQGNTRSAHVFGDVTKRWNETTLAEVSHILDVPRQTISMTKEASQIGQKELEELMARETSRVSAEIQQVFARSPLFERAYCYRCQKQCVLHDVDVQAVRRAGGLVLHAASPVCKDHSLQNYNRLGLFGAHGLSWVSWLAERARRASERSEDVILMEITPKHASKELLMSALPHHKVFTFVLDPTQFGLPSHRSRRYSLAFAPWLLATSFKSELFLSRQHIDNKAKPPNKILDRAEVRLLNLGPGQRKREQKYLPKQFKFCVVLQVCRFPWPMMGVGFTGRQTCVTSTRGVPSTICGNSVVEGNHQLCLTNAVLRCSVNTTGSAGRAELVQEIESSDEEDGLVRMEDSTSPESMFGCAMKDGVTGAMWYCLPVAHLAAFLRTRGQSNFRDCLQKGDRKRLSEYESAAAMPVEKRRRGGSVGASASTASSTDLGPEAERTLCWIGVKYASMPLGSQRRVLVFIEGPLPSPRRSTDEPRPAHFSKYCKESGATRLSSGVEAPSAFGLCRDLSFRWQWLVSSMQWRHCHVEHVGLCSAITHRRAARVSCARVWKNRTCFMVGDEYLEQTQRASEVA
eukprot:6491537-Amphidinium_carterae.1